jgi:hypothetical protein
LPRSLLERSYASLGRVFNRPSMQFQVDQELGGADVRRRLARDHGDAERPHAPHARVSRRA